MKKGKRMVELLKEYFNSIFKKSKVKLIKEKSNLITNTSIESNNFRVNNDNKYEDFNNHEEIKSYEDKESIEDLDILNDTINNIEVYDEDLEAFQEYEKYEEVEKIDNIENDDDFEMEKKDFFLLYENVKKGTVKLENLMIFDILRIQLMMKSELDSINKKIADSEKKIKTLKLTINNLKEEKDRYYKRINNN